MYIKILYPPGSFLLEQMPFCSLSQPPVVEFAFPPIIMAIINKNNKEGLQPDTSAELNAHVPRAEVHSKKSSILPLKWLILQAITRPVQQKRKKYLNGVCRAACLNLP
jgi:hypothetical protein